MRRLFVLIFSLSLIAAAGGTASARDLPDFTQLVEKNSPAVVNISTKQKRRTSSIMQQFPDLPEGGPWDELFRHFFGDQDGNGRDEDPGMDEARSLGSGFVIDDDGYILTNNHVVDGADEILVRLSDRREVEAEVVGSDKRSDLALLKIDAADLPEVKLGKSRELKVGEWVMAIGSPFGFDHSVSVGVVSALGRSLPSENYVPFIQTDVAINPGNSGGPLINLDGEVVGINSQIYSRTGGFMGLSFAIPIDIAMDVVAQLKDKGYVSRGWLGVLIQDVTRELAESFAMEKPAGALVAQVLDNSPASAAGLQTGDIILAFDGQEIAYSSDLPPLVGRTPVGKKVKVKVLRNGKVTYLSLAIAELPAEEELGKAGGKAQKAKSDRLGLMVGALSQEQRSANGVASGGVVVESIDQGAAAAAGIQRGDIIVKLNYVDIRSVDHYRELVRALPEGRSVPVLIIRRGSPIFLPLRVPE